MRKQAVESAELGHESFTRVWTVVRLVNQNGTDQVANRNPGLGPRPSPTTSAHLVGVAGWFVRFWFRTWPMASKKNSSSDPIKEMTWVIACPPLTIFCGTQVILGLGALLPWCPGKETPSDTLISIFFFSFWAVLFLSKSQASAFCCMRKLWPRINVIPDVYRDVANVSNICQVWDGAVQEISYITTFGFFNMKSCQQISFSSLIHPPKGYFLGGLEGCKKRWISGLSCAEWTAAPPASSSHTLFHINHVIDLISSGFKSFFSLPPLFSPHNVSGQHLPGRRQSLHFSRHETQLLGLCNTYTHLTFVGLSYTYFLRHLVNS